MSSQPPASLNKGGRVPLIALTLLSLCSYFFVFFHRVAPSTLIQSIKTDFHLSNTEFGWLGSVYFYFYAVLQLPTGMWVDRYKGKGVRQLLIGGTALAGCGAILFGLSETFTMAILTRTLLALGVSVIFVSCLRLISLIYPPEKFSTFSGITVTIGTLGAISAGLPLYGLLHDFSWQSIHIGIGVIGILLTIGLYISFSHVQKTHAQLFELTSTHAMTKDRALLKSVIMNRQSWYAMGINFFVGATVFGFSGLWGVRYLTSVVGASSLQGTLALSCFFAGFGSGSFLLGSLSSLLGRRKSPMILGSTASLGLVGFLVMAPVYSIEIYYVIYALIGFFGSAFTVAWASAKENNSPDAAGMATSTANIGAFIGTALMQPTMGWMLDHSQKIAQLPLFSGTLSSFHPFKPIFALMWVFHLFSLMCILAIRETYCKNQQVTTS